MHAGNTPNMQHKLVVHPRHPVKLIEPLMSAECLRSALAVAYRERTDLNGVAGDAKICNMS
jgi:hypothetical protein